jgi:hypothetical protein
LTSQRKSSGARGVVNTVATRARGESFAPLEPVKDAPGLLVDVHTMGRVNCPDKIKNEV